MVTVKDSLRRSDDSFHEVCEFDELKYRALVINLDGKGKIGVLK